MTPDLLNLSLSDLVSSAADDVRAEDYPASWGEFPLRYAFTPGEEGDGVTVDFPLARLYQPDGAGRFRAGRCRGCARSW